MNLIVKPEGRWELLKYEKGAPAPFDVQDIGNALDAGGLNLCMRLIGGIATTGHFGNNSVLQVLDAQGGVQNNLACDVGYPMNGGGNADRSVVWQFSDISVAQYNANRVRMINGLGTILSFNDNTGWGNKPNTQNWIYRYTLSLPSPPEFFDIKDTDPGTHFGGLTRMLRLIAGMTNPGHWGGAGLSIFETGPNALSAGRSFYGEDWTHRGAVQVDANFPTVVGSSITWEFTTSGATGRWEYVELTRTPMHGGGVSTDQGLVLRLVARTMPADATWTYRYTMTWQ